MTIGTFFSGDLQPTTTVAGCIDIYKDVWQNYEQTIQEVENEINTDGTGVYWNKAKTVSEEFSHLRTNLHTGITHFAKEVGNPVMKNVHNQMYTLLMNTLEGYRKRYGISEPLWHEGYNMLKYEGGNEYKSHYDGGTTTGRSVSAIIYLNDNYTGGDIEFTNFGVKIKPEPGTLMLFPSNYAYTHIAHPVISGTKYALVTWMKDRPLQPQTLIANNEVK